MEKIETKSPNEGIDEFDRKIEEFFNDGGKAYEAKINKEYAELEEWRRKWIERECKAQLSREKNCFNPFANLRKINQYPDPDVHGAYHLRKMREEGWSDKHEEDLDYDGGAEAFLEYGNEDEWYDDINEICYELNFYKKHWFIGRMIQFRKAFKEVSYILKGCPYRGNPEDSFFHKIKEAYLTLFHGSKCVRNRSWKEYRSYYLTPSYDPTSYDPEFGKNYH